MEVIRMKLADMKKPEKNIRIHTEKQLKEFQRSVEMFGQIRPIIIDENNVIMAGNGLYDTLVMMGKESADVCRYSELTENQKKKLMIADNKIFTLGLDNMEVIDSFLEELQGDLDIPGFDEDILKQMMADTEDITQKIAEYGTLDEEEIKSIKANAGRKEQVSQQVEDRTEDNVSVDGERHESDQQEGQADDEAAEKKEYVICPKCGEKIWL